MFNTTQLTGKNLESLVRIALINRELSPGAAAAIENYRAKPNLTAAERRQLEVLDQAILDGCIGAIEGYSAIR